MTTGDTDPSTEALQPNELQTAAQLIATLMRTPDEGLEQLRSQLVGRSAEVDVAHLRLARKHLEAVYLAIKGDDSARWQELEAAAKVLTSAAASLSDAPPQSSGLGVLSQSAFLGGQPPALPFDSDKPPPRSEEAAPPVAPSPDISAPASQEAGDRRPDTEPPGPPSVAEVLPFVAAPRPPSVAPPVVDAPAGEVPSGVHDEETMVSESGEGVAAPISEGISLSIEQFALLCVKCERSPGNIEAVHSEFGIRGERSREAVHQQWQQRLKSDETLRRTWDALRAQYRSSTDG